MNTKSLNINEEIFNKAQEYCLNNGITLNGLTENLLENFIINSEPCEKLASDELIMELIEKRIESCERGETLTFEEFTDKLNKELNLCLQK